MRKRADRLLAGLVALAALESPAAASECEWREAVAFAYPERSVEIAAREPGILARVAVEPGDEVEAGALIAELDKTLALADLAAARARADARGREAVAEARRAQAARRAEELARLRRAGAARQVELAEAEAALAVAEAEIEAIRDDRREAELIAERAEARLALLDVRAPFAGVVDELHRREAELVGAGGEARVATLIGLDLLRAEFFLDAACLDGARPGAAAAIAAARGGAPIEARIADLARDVDAATGLRGVTLEIDNSARRLLPGERLLLAAPIAAAER